MINNCIVSFGKGYNFQKGLDRLRINIENLVKIPFISFTEYPIDCPVHEKSPFAFKFFCINECVKKGFKKILWLDSSVIIKNDLSDIFNNYLENQGYFFIKNWHSVGQYCHDKALKTLNITREESFRIPCVQGTNFGLNFNNEKSQIFQKEMLKYAVDNITFPGPYDNKNNMASNDTRVSGHRHDQTAMSVVALRLGMNNWWPFEEHKWFIHDRQFVKDVTSTVIDINMKE